MEKRPEESNGHAFCVAPMIDWTDRYCRFFHRQLSQHARLYTEMIVDQAILKGDEAYLLGFDPQEHPVALQLGGSDPETLARAARIGEAFGYDEINLNVGCPSDRVQSGTFGACLMREPQRVADCAKALQEAVNIPVTIKCRIGVDDQNPDEILPDFLCFVDEAGVKTVIIHARKAWLQGLSPKENRTIPPLDYALVNRMKVSFNHLNIVLNGGIATLEEAKAHLDTMDGVMLGRAAYEMPYLLSQVDHLFFGATKSAPTRAEVVRSVAKHFDAQDVPLWRYARHMIGLYHGQKGARRWRHLISSEGRQQDRGAGWIIQLAEEIDLLNEEMEDLDA